MTNGTEIIKNLPDQVKKRKAAEVPVKLKRARLANHLTQTSWNRICSMFSMGDTGCWLLRR